MRPQSRSQDYLRRVEDKPYDQTFCEKKQQDQPVIAIYQSSMSSREYKNQMETRVLATHKR